MLYIYICTFSPQSFTIYTMATFPWNCNDIPTILSQKCQTYLWVYVHICITTIVIIIVDFLYHEKGSLIPQKVSYLCIYHRWVHEKKKITIVKWGKTVGPLGFSRYPHAIKHDTRKSCTYRWFTHRTSIHRELSIQSPTSKWWFHGEVLYKL